MKKFLLFIILSFAFANAQLFYDRHGESHGAYKDSMEYAKLVELAQKFRGPILVKKPVEGVKPRKNLEKIPQDKIQRTFDVKRKSLRKELWLEVEKNEIVKVCVDRPVVAWETSMNSNIFNDSCLVFKVPTLIGVEKIRVYFSNANLPKNINLAIGMKYLNFKNKEVLLGFNKFEDRKGDIFISHSPESDPERFVSVSGTYLVDKYPVTNCEITQLMWDSLPANPSFVNKQLKEFAEQRTSRKNNSIRNENCVTHDSAACLISLLQAMKYANARSSREGLKPYYIFSANDYDESKILSKGRYVIGNYDYDLYTYNRFILVEVDETSDGYRLPYYDEWMMFARGGDKKNKAPWGDSSVAFEETAKYARFATWKHYYESEPVGQLLPNGYGLYDIFGLVYEHVLFEERNPFKGLKDRPSCLKGGDHHVKKEYEQNSIDMFPYWKWINYGYYKSNYNGGMDAGFRLIRNIGNNAKWSNDKVQKTDTKSEAKDNPHLGDLSSFFNSLKKEPPKKIAPRTDTTKQKRKQEKVVFEGYIKPLSRDILFGVLSDKGSVVVDTPAIPLIDKIPNDWIRSYFAHSNFARVAKVWVIKHPKTNVKKIKARISLLKSDSTSYGFNPVNIELYKKGEEGGFYVFQTMTNSKGKPLLFSKDESDIGNYEDAVILCLKKDSDLFYYQMLE